MSKVYPGFWDGTVVSVKAPTTEPHGSVQVRIPDIHGNVTEVPDNVLPWAWPNFMFAGPNCGLMGVPPVTAIVNLIFKHGNPKYPLWIGGGHRSTGTPSEFITAKAGLEPKGWMWITPGGYKLVLNEQAQTIELKMPTPSLTALTLDLALKKAEVVSDSGGTTPYTLTLDETQQKASITTPTGQIIELNEASGEVKLSGTQKAILIAALVEIGIAPSEAVILGNAFAVFFDLHTHNVTAIGSPTGFPVPLMASQLATLLSQTVSMSP